MYRDAAMLAELRMPVVELGDRLLLVPLVGELCQSRFAHGTDELLTSIARVRARFVLFDLTGVPTVDTAVARNLVRTIQAAALLGCHGALCGVRPEVAALLTGLEADLGPVQSFSSLRAALLHAADEQA